MVIKVCSCANNSKKKVLKHIIRMQCHAYLMYWSGSILIRTRIFARCIPVWNSLPLEAVNDLSLSVFKATVINIILLPTA